MTLLAQKLMMLNGKRVISSQPTDSAIFGSARSLSRFTTTVNSRSLARSSLDGLPAGSSRIRIGLWPCVSAEAPKLAMGLNIVLAFLLERYSDIQVYRILAKLDDTQSPDSYEWYISDSQFGIDDWEIEGLDENVFINSTLNKSDGKWQLQVEVESEFDDEDEDVPVFSLQAADTLALIKSLPQLVEQIAVHLNTSHQRLTATTYQIENGFDEESLHNFLSLVFEWELNLYLLLWGKAWEDEDIEQLLDRLISSAAILDDFGAWTLGLLLRRTFLPGFALVGDILAPKIPQIAETFLHYPALQIHLGWSALRMGRSDVAYVLLERAVEAHQQSPRLWLTLAEAYRSERGWDDALDTFQTAIELEAVDSVLYQRYADLLLTASYNDYEFEEFLLIDPDDYDGDYAVWEAIAAFEAAYELDNDIDTLYYALVQLSSLDEDMFWDKFSQLANADTTGEYVRNLLESAHDIDDFTPAIEALEHLNKENPERVDILINMGLAYTLNDEHDKAIELLEQALEKATEPEHIADIQRLLLVAEDPMFEARFAELTSQLEAGKSISESDMDFLEEALETAPSIVDLYLAIARGYALWEDFDAAIEVLEDGLKELPDDPDITELYAGVLWLQDKTEAAITTLEQALEKHPHHVPLLCRMGRCMFDSDEEELAREYLARAELIEPENPILRRTRAYIARALANE